MPERKYMLHSAKYFDSGRTKRPIKDGMELPIGSRTNTVQQHKKSYNKWKKELQYLKKQNQTLYSIAKKYFSRREIKDQGKNF